MRNKNYFFPDNPSQNNLELNNILKKLSLADEELILTQRELFKRKSDFADFSYSISHTLRKNIANIKGLLNLINEIEINDEAKSYLGVLTDEVEQIDEELHELNEIIKLQYSSLDTKEIVQLEEKFLKIKELFSKQLEKVNAKVITDFSAFDKMFTSKELIGNIFQELIVNAIKFKHPDKDLEISIGSYISNDRIGVEFRDNGIGIDLKSNNEFIFRPYKKLNPEKPGKGLGLYLLKHQVEALGGEIKVTSELGQGSTFSIYLSKPENIKDIILDSPLIRVVYNEEHQLMIANWKRKIKPIEFREVFSYLIHLMKKYKLKNWIANILNAESDENELNEVRKAFVDSIIKIDLQKMALVVPFTELSEEKVIERKHILKKIYPFEVDYFRTLEDAINWVKEKN